MLNPKNFKNFEEYIECELNADGTLNDYYPYILKRGIYHEQILPYIEAFGKSNVLIFESNYFKNNKIEVTNDVLSAVNLSPLNIKSKELEPIHNRTYESPISKDLNNKLKSFYKPFNKRLLILSIKNLIGSHLSDLLTSIYQIIL